MRKTRKLSLALWALLLVPTIINAAEPAVRINELAWMGTAISSTDEWIELYNPTDQTVDLNGWTLKATDGSPAINLTGSIIAGGYFLLERTDDTTVPTVPADQFFTGSIGNTGENFILTDVSNKSIDTFDASSGWPGGDNTTKQTLERNTAGGWQTSTEPGGTPRQLNSLVVPTTTPPTDSTTPDDTTNQSAAAETDDQTTDTEPTAAHKGDIVFNEIYTNPPGVDTNSIDPEFIELKNVAPTAIDLTGWVVTTAGQQRYELPSLIMSPNSMVLMTRIQTGLTLNNQKEKLTLKSTRGIIINQLSIPEVPEGLSYQRTDGGTYLQATPTPRTGTIATVVIEPTLTIYGPKSALVGDVLLFDASDSFSADGSALLIHWDFADGRVATGPTARQVYTKPGTFMITVNAATTQASSTEKFKITIHDPKNIEAIDPDDTPTTTKKVATDSPKTDSTPATPNIADLEALRLVEFLPNPTGADTEGEFIELFNQGDQIVSLTDWQLDDEQGGSRPYHIAAGTIIKPGQYKAFFRPQTKLALNNDTDTIQLLAPDGTIIDQAEYKKTTEGTSYVLDEQGQWQPSQTPTPDEINVLDEASDSATSTPTTTPSQGTQPAVLGAELTPNDQLPTAPNATKGAIAAGATTLAVGALAAWLKIKKRPAA